MVDGGVADDVVLSSGPCLAGDEPSLCGWSEPDCAELDAGMAEVCVECDGTA